MFKQPKIAINGTYIQQQASGLGVVNQNLISRLMDSDSDWDLVLYSNSNYWQQTYGDRLKSVTSYLAPDRGFPGHITRLLWYQTLLNWQLKKQHTSLFYSPVAEGIIFPTIPQIVTLHDLIPIKYPELNPKWKYYYYYYVLPTIFKNSQAVICVSEHTKKDAIAHYNLREESIQVVYPGFDSNVFYPQPNVEVLKKYSLDKYLLFVGDMRFYKNLGRCLEAFEQLPLNQEYKFVVTGKKDSFFYPAIQKQTDNLGVKDRVVFLDYVPSSDLPTLYSMAEVLVFASLYEGFGLPVLEAMACGCPVIASDVTSIPEVGGDSVYYVDPYDIESISKGLYEILTNENLRANLINKGKARAKLFSWEKMARDIVKVFELVVSS